MDAPGQQAARSEFKATRAGYLPRLDFEQSYLAGNNPVFVFGTLLTQRQFHCREFCASFAQHPGFAIDNLQTRATVQQNIWDFGRTGNRREQARLGMKWRISPTKITSDRSCCRFRQLLCDVAGRRCARDRRAWRFRSAEAIESQAKARVESGLAVEADLLRSRVYLSDGKAAGNPGTGTTRKRTRAAEPPDGKSARRDRSERRLR